MCWFEVQGLIRSYGRSLASLVIGLGVLEIAWVLSGAYGAGAYPFWLIKLGIIALAGYLVTDGDDE